MELTNKEKAIELVQAFTTGSPKVLDFISDEVYVQHNLAFPDGKSALNGFFSGNPTGIDVTVHRAFEDGNKVVVHSTYGGVWNNKQPQVAFDIFKFKDGLIVEHWDNLQDVTPANLSGHTETDGPTSYADLDKMEANKAYAKNFVDIVLVNADYSNVASFFNGNNYINHSPGVADGLDGLNDALGAMAKAGITMKYDNIHQVIGKGDMVLVLSEGYLGDQHKAFYDLFRIEDLKIAEHWDVVADIPAKAGWNNNNGKF